MYLYTRTVTKKNSKNLESVILSYGKLYNPKALLKLIKHV